MDPQKKSVTNVKSLDPDLDLWEGREQEPSPVQNYLLTKNNQYIYIEY